MVRLFALIGLMAAFALVATAQQPTPPTRTINVTGTATRQVPPDVGIVVVAVETQAATVALAVTQNNTIANRVTTAVRGLNIPNLTIRTLGFDVQPIYEQPAPNRPVTQPLRIIAYRVTNRLEARIPQANPDQLSAAVGQVIDTALAAGANRVDNVSFTLQNEQPAMREALAEATRNARDTAAALAAAAGVTLGRLMNLTTTPMYQPPTPMFARAAEAGQGVPIIAGPLTMQVTVNATYEIQ